jgi:enediyne biosynthesis protein E4
MRHARCPAGAPRRLFVPLLLAAAAALAGCSRLADGDVHATSAAPGVRFTDVTEAAGIRFRHTSGRSGRFYLPETLPAGCAFLDYNNDGKLDLFLVNSSRLPGSSAPKPTYSALYRNDGNGRFTDVTREAGLAVDCYGLGVAVADYDGDGFQDLYLTAMGPNHLFHNNGDGTFTDLAQKAGVADARFSTCAAWLDYDRDGNLDLFVGNYARWSPALNQLCPDSLGRVHLCGPTYYQGESSALYHNNGDGTFRDVTKKAGLYDTVGKALGVVVWDEDDDGWLDLVVAKDMEPNLFYHNNRDGTFSEQGVVAGVAYSNRGETRAGMGIDTADIANTGRESLLIGNNAGQGLAIYAPDPGAAGALHFTDVAEQAGIYRPSLPFSTFGAAFVDYDGDGFKDIVTANGHLDENVHLGSPWTFAQNLGAYRNLGNGRFVSAGESLGPAFQEKRLWRGLAVGDFDGDGDPDLLLASCNGRPALLRNDGGNANSWLQVKAIGAGKNRDGIGTRVTVTANGVRQVGWIRSGSSYCSQHELVAFFGLGAAAQADTVEVRFPDGARQTLKDVKARQRIVVEEGRRLSGGAR